MLTRLCRLTSDVKSLKRNSLRCNPTTSKINLESACSGDLITVEITVEITVGNHRGGFTVGESP